VVPAPDNPRLAGVLGIEVDEHGFFGQPDPLRDPLHTTRPGVFVAGGAQGPLDIPDSVAQASGAAGRAAAPLAGRPRHTERPQVAERAAASDAPRTGVFVCSCGKNIGGYVDVPEVATSAESMPHVVASDTYLFACSEDAQRRIREAIEAHDLNRVVLAACSPITHAAVFQQTCEEAGINANLFEMANIRNQCSWVHSDRRDLATAKARDMVRMAVARSAHLRPLPRQEIDVTPAALVIGGGIAGMRAALRLGGMGIDTVLVEREATLGGRLNDLYTLFPADIPARDVLDPLHSEVEQCPHLRVLLEHEVRHVAGYVGNFEVTVDARDGSSSITLTAGSIIVATGAQEIDLSGRYGYGAHPNVITQTELEQRLRDGTLGAPQSVVMLNCAGSMEPENPSCCRVGCGVSVKNMRHIRQAAPQASLYLLYQDLRMFGTRDEQYFTGMVEQARPTLVRYQAEQRPQVTVAADGSLRVRVYDVLLREEHEIAADLVVLTAATRGDADTSRLKQILKVCANDEDFYSEAHAKIRPLDFATDGIYLCGTAQAPKNVPDSLAQAEGAAARAAIPLLRGSVAVEPSIAEIDPARCTGCGICEPLCPYHAISLDDSQRVATITGVMCKGCGTCVAACPSAAAQQRNFTDEQLTAMLAAAWEWEEYPA
jgi:heterodisulfide reductase subunit A